MFSLLKKFRDNSARQAQRKTLRKGLIDNYWQEAFYRAFPRITQVREHICVGDTKYKIRVEPYLHRTVSVSVFEDTNFVGTLTFIMDQQRFSEVKTAYGADYLYDKVMHLNKIDEAERTAPRSYEPTPDPKPSSMENIIPFPSL